MKVEVKYSLGFSQETIDLTDYGFSESVKWEELTVDQQNVVTDLLRSENVVMVSMTDIKE